jgi:pimeloyl-ACP methyl ester carboxylesterase
MDPSSSGWSSVGAYPKSKARDFNPWQDDVDVLRRRYRIEAGFMTMTPQRLCPFLALAALLLLGGCAGLTHEPRLPRTTAPAETRRDLLTAGLRPGTIEGPRGMLRYFEGGEGKTVVLLHGSGSQAGDWHDVVPALLRRYRLLVLDLPGHGESGPAEGPLPVGDLADGLGALLDAKSAGQPVILVGNSLGGWVSLLYAWRHPERVERVIGISTSGIFTALKVPLNPKNREEARRLVAAIRGPYLPVPSDEELDELMRRIAAGPAPRLFAGLRAEDFLETKAAGIQVPVELVWGEEDGVLPPDYGRRLASLLPHARFHSLPRCGHMPQVHCPRELARLLLDLLNGHDRTPSTTSATRGRGR